MSARILVGSCSWTDPTLISSGRFYPAGVNSAEARLRYYAEQFDIVEVDATYYAPPSARNSELWAARTPPGFVFNVKAFALADPPRRGPGPAARLAAQPAAGRGARQALGLPARHRRAGHGARVAAAPRGARAAGGGRQARRGAVPVPAVVRALARQPRLPALAAGAAARLARSRWSSAAAAGWTDESAARHAARCSRRPAWPTWPSTSRRGSPTARPRCRRRRRRWRWCACTGATRTRGRAAPAAASDRFKYLYSDAELEEWVPRVRELAAQSAAVHVLFNNNYEDWGMQNARRMAHLLGVERRPPQTQLEIS